jgi:3-hexulose-6-phosphate synthase/6-phospho-3-hexuloisomerase
VTEPILQVAIDVIQLHRALQIAKEAIEGGADWIEIGTPLIKSEGVNAIREIKKRFPHHVIVADMKTMDTGAYETEMASKAGANVVCVLGVADNETIKESVRAARKYGSEIMIDLLGVKNPAARCKELKDFGVDYVCFHIGIDEQMRGRISLKTLKEISETTKIKIAVAGGLNSETVVEAMKFGASVLIVGSAITKAENVSGAAKIIKTAMKEKRAVRSESFRKHSEDTLFEAFSKVSTANISDAMHRKGAMKGITPVIKSGVKVVGRALTVKTIDGDWAKAVEAIDRAKKGDVLVVDAGGGQTAVWGELASWSCKIKGIAGVVIDGACRDIQHIKNLDFPVFVKHIVSNAGEPKGYGEIGCEIVCGGEVVRTGDWIIGDENGVVVVPKDRAVEIANRAIDVMETENRIREEIKRGSSLSKVLDLLKWEKIG